MGARISLAAVTFFLLPSIVAQTAPAPSDQVATIRTRSEEVLLDVVVRDKHRKLVTNLRPNEIEVYEDGGATGPQDLPARRRRGSTAN